MQREPDVKREIEDAVMALLPIVPVTGSFMNGYHISQPIDPTLRATPEEWADAAQAVCDLHALARGMK